jgi:hypothetical protein
VVKDMEANQPRIQVAVRILGFRGHRISSITCRVCELQTPAMTVAPVRRTGGHRPGARAAMA